MEEWKEYKLGDVGQIITGKTPLTKVPSYYDGTIHFVSPSDLNSCDKNILYTAKTISNSGLQSIKGCTLPKRTICVSCIGNLGYVGITTMECASNQQINSIIVDGSRFDVDFIYYAIKNLWRYFKSQENQSTTISIINKSTFSNIEIYISSLETQKKIASFLSSLDDKIAVNKRICENLEAQAQALFKHWFVDFAPFKDGKFVESELGLIPEGWEVVTLDEYVDNLGGYSYTGGELQPSKTAMATIKNFVRGGGFKIEGYKEIVISKNIKDYQYVNLFDVLVAHTDLTQNAEVVGNPAIILSTAGYEKLIMSMDLTKVVSKDVRITAPLLHCILSTRKFKEHALGYVNGTTVLHMNKKAVPEYQIAMPKKLDIIKDLTTILDILYHMMSETYSENLRLSTLRDTLLPKLMSGQIKL